MNRHQSLFVFPVSRLGRSEFLDSYNRFCLVMGNLHADETDVHAVMSITVL